MTKLSEYLRDNALTHQAFAERVGVHQSTITRLCDEDGIKVPSIETALAIERETGGAVSAADWIGRRSTNAAEAARATG